MSLSNLKLTNLPEDAAGGSTGAGGIATGATDGVKFVQSRRKKYTKAGKAPRKLFSEAAVGFDSNPGNVDDIISKLQSVQMSSINTDKPTVAFGLEDANGGIIRVRIPREQAADFERALSTILRDAEVKLDIAEVLFNLRNRFEFTDIKWPEDSITEADGDEEEEPIEDMPEPPIGDEEMPLDDEDATLVDDDLGDEFGSGMGTEPAPAAGAGDLQSVLSSLVGMLKADADARKAEADARAKQAQAEEAKYAAELASNKIRSEEEVLDMEEWNKGKREKDAEVKKLAKLARYRFEKSRTAADSATDEVDPSVFGVGN